MQSNAPRRVTTNYVQQYFVSVDEEGFLMGNEATEASMLEGRTGDYVATEILVMGANHHHGLVTAHVSPEAIASCEAQLLLPDMDMTADTCI